MKRFCGLDQCLGFARALARFVLGTPPASFLAWHVRLSPRQLWQEQSLPYSSPMQPNGERSPGHGPLDAPERGSELQDLQ